MRELVTIVFSKDRPAQLHLLLESIEKFQPSGVFISNLFVIYKASDESFQEGYDIVQKSFDGVFLVKETDIKQDVLRIIGNRRASHVMFLVDDQVMIHELNTRMLNIFALLAGQPVATVSLRLGRNTYWQYQTNSQTVMPRQVKEWEGLLIWNRETISSTQNFGYPLSVDAHIFRTDLITPLIDKIPTIRIPNDLEAAWQQFLPHIPPLMACQPHSSFVSIPVNLVQDIYQNKTGSNIHPVILNQMYLDGQRIDLDWILGHEIIGCHQDMELRFR